jgi:hypothetical protein
MSYVVEDDADAPDVALDAVVGLLLEDELGGHVENGADASSSFADVFLSHLFGESEISKFGTAILLQEYILSLNIPMGDIQVIQQASSINNIPQYPQYIPFGQVPFHLDIIFKISI